MSMESTIFPIHKPRTRCEWIRLLEEFVEPAAKRVVVEEADLPLPRGGNPYGEAPARLERVARVLVGVALLARATGDMASLNRFKQVIVIGTDPNSPAFFGFPKDYDQRVVEMASIALSLALCPDELWYALTEAERKNLRHWLSLANEVTIPNHNWVLFRLFINAVLHYLQVPCENDRSETDWATNDARYAGDGWYNDAEGGLAFDYYNAEGFHYYALLIHHFHPSLSEERRSSIRERALEFIPAHSALQAPDGLFLPYGRSLSYRFIPIAFNGACALNGLGEVAGHRSVMERCFAFWDTQDYRDGGGLLSIGFAYPNHNIVENYTAPGSPYYCLHTFLPVCLPEAHPFWQSPETSHPTALPEGDTIEQRILTAPGITVINDHKRAHHWALFAGQRMTWNLRHEGEKYAKFAYSSKHGFQVTGGWHGLNRLGFDSSVAISEDEIIWYLRERPQDCKVLQSGSVFSRWGVPNRLEVETTVSMCDGIQVRKHVIRVLCPLVWLEGGWCLPIENANLFERDSDSRQVWLKGRGPWFSAIGSVNEVSSDFVVSDPNLNVLHPLTVLPYLKEAFEVGTYERTRLVAGYGVSLEAWKSINQRFVQI